MSVRTSIYVVPIDQTQHSGKSLARLVGGLCTRGIAIMPALVVEPLLPHVPDPLGLGDTPDIFAPRSPDQGDLVEDVTALGHRLGASTPPGDVEIILHINKHNARMAEDFELPALDCCIAIYSYALPMKLTLEHERFESAAEVKALGHTFWYLCFRGISPPFSWRFRGAWIEHQLLSEIGPFRVEELAHF